jgi:hypothetical protein
MTVPFVFGPHQRQSDPAWSGRPLGASKELRVGSHGCLLTAMKLAAEVGALSPHRHRLLFVLIVRVAVV